MATVSKEFITRVLEIAAAEFCKAGWTKRKNGFSLDLSEDIYGVVGLNKAIGRGNGILEINPVVGVGSQKLEKLWLELLGQKFRPYVGAAIGRNVGYLMHGKTYKSWLFHQEANCEAVVADMVATVQEYGPPFMQQHMQLSALCEAMKHAKVSGPHDQYRIPVACVLLGKNAEAETFLEVKLKEMGGRNDRDAESFRSFAVKLRETIKRAGSRLNM
jgi:hypothetical protein